MSVSSTRLCSTARFVGRCVVVAAIIGLFTVPCEAIDLSGSSGTFRLNIDTTVSWGARYRVQDRDPAIISPFEGGTAWSVNGDDGNLNFDKGFVSNTLKATIDFDLAIDVARNHSIGVFARGSGFYDFELENDCCARTELSQDALDWAGSRVELLDAYAWWQFPIGEFRIGRQVLNWGESTFIPGGISVTNPVDLSALRVPGAELREAYRPVGLGWLSINLSRDLAVEAYYQFEWEETVIDPPGTYFSTNDFAGRGGERVFLAFASFPDTGESPFFMQPPVDYPFMSVPRGADQEPKDGGQYGLALRWFVPQLGGTEFGFYYINYHSRLPLVNGVTGTLQGALDAQAAAPNAALAVYAALGVPPGVSPEADAAAAGAANAAAVAVFANTASYFIAYPEDIKLYGLSWNAQLGTSGIAFQGEASYRQDAPYLIDDVELLFAALSPLSATFADASQVTNGTPLGFEETALGYRLHDSAQLQFTLTKVWSRVLGADQAVLLFEPGFDWVFDMPDKDELRYDGPGTYTSGNPEEDDPGGIHAGKASEEPKHFADPFSWGYRLAGKLTYNNAIGAWSLNPRFGWQHDVDGVTPGPGGNFIAGRTALTLGVSATYQNRWEVDLSYTMYSGADRWNLINDRDFVGGFIRYSF
ncbi:MAG: DUF1302 domain-containing protein [Holophagae bacterium]